MGIRLHSPTQGVLEAAIGWLRQQGRGINGLYEREQRRHRSYTSRRHRRLPLLTPAKLEAMSRCASTHTHAAKVLEALPDNPHSFRGEPPWGTMTVGRIEDGGLRYLARTWERCAVTEDADAALRAAWMARWSFVYG